MGLIGLDLQRFKRKLHKNTPRRGTGAAVWLWLLALFRRAVPSAAVWLRGWGDLFIWPRSDAGPYTFHLPAHGVPDAGFLCILPFKGAAGGPDRAGSAAVQAQTAQKHSPAGCWAAVWLWLLTLVRRAGVFWDGLGAVRLCGFFLVFGNLGKFFYTCNGSSLACRV